MIICSIVHLRCTLEALPPESFLCCFVSVNAFHASKNFSKQPLKLLNECLLLKISVHGINSWHLQYFS